MDPNRPILCVTPNPSIDRTWVVPGFAAGCVWRAQDVSAQCGGKGVNVARVLGRLGRQAIAAGPVGGHTGRHATDLAALEGLKTAWTWTTAETRTCAIIVNPETGDATVVNEPGPMLSPADWDRLIDDAAAAAGDCAAIAISGSLPRGVAPDAVARLIEAIRDRCSDVYVDTSGDALVKAVASRPLAIKVNGDEVGALTGVPCASHAEAVAAAMMLRRQGIALAAVTLGVGGAVLVDAAGAWTATAPSIDVVNPIGSGDAFLAALIAARLDGLPPGACLRQAIAAGTANALAATGGDLRREDVEQLARETVVNAVTESSTA